MQFGKLREQKHIVMHDKKNGFKLGASDLKSLHM